MNMQEIRSLAEHHGVKATRMSKVQLVQAIQHREGNFECFATATQGYCDQLDCLWRADCFASARKRKQ
jgi:hypothetical protein